MNNKPTIKDMLAVISTFAQVCYIAGKVEGKNGDMKDNSEELCQFPEDIFRQMLQDVMGEKLSEEQENHLHHNCTEKTCFKEIINAEITKEQPEIVKTEITAEKEEELIKKFGKKPMEKLAKAMGFEGKILNNKQ